MSRNGTATAAPGGTGRRRARAGTGRAQDLRRKSEDSSEGGAGYAERDWEEFLRSRLSRNVRVVYGRSRTCPLQARRVAPGRIARGLSPQEASEWIVRLHSMFRAAPVEVRDAVAELLRSGRRARRASGLLDAWIADTLPRHPPAPVRKETLVSRGRIHDLERIAGEVLREEFRGEFGRERASPGLTWGRTGARGPRRAMRLGSYDAELDLVRVHPALDQEGVPAWFLRYVLFHELLHAVFPPVRNPEGRWIRHGREFRARERAYPDLERALAWERGNIDALIRSARTGRPLKSSPKAAPKGPRGAPATLRALVQRLLFPI